MIERRTFRRIVAFAKQMTGALSLRWHASKEERLVRKWCKKNEVSLRYENPFNGDLWFIGPAGKTFELDERGGMLVKAIGTPFEIGRSYMRVGCSQCSESARRDKFVIAARIIESVSLVSRTCVYRPARIVLEEPSAQFVDGQLKIEDDRWRLAPEVVELQ